MDGLLAHVAWPTATSFRIIEVWASKELWDEGLRKGESMIVVPASSADRVSISQLMAGNGVHAVFYLASGTSSR